MNCICRGTSTLDTNTAWKIPLGLFLIVPTIVVSLIWFIQEVGHLLCSISLLLFKSERQCGVFLVTPMAPDQGPC